MSDLLVTDVVTGERVGAATRPLGESSGLFSRAVWGKGRLQSFLSVEEPAWPISGAEANCKGPVNLRAGAPLPSSGAGSAEPCAQGHPWEPGRWGLPGDELLWAFQGLSSLQVGPAGSLSRLHAPGARGGWVGLGGHCQASFALLSSRPRRRRTPPWENPRRGAAHRPPPGGVEEVSQRRPDSGGGSCGSGLAENTLEGKIFFPLGLWLQLTPP